MKATTGYCILECEKLMQNTVTAPGGMEFYIDTRWDPMHHVKIDHVVAARSNEGPSYFNYGFKNVPRINADFQEGDRVFVLWSFVSEENLFTIGEKRYLKVPIGAVFAKVTASGVQACGEWVLLEPMKKDEGPATTLIIPKELREKTTDEYGLIVSKGSAVMPEIEVGKLGYIKKTQARANPGVEKHDRNQLNALRIGNRLDGDSLAFLNYVDGVPYYVQFGGGHNYESMGSNEPGVSMNEIVFTCGCEPKG
jgi:hypothetical protein